MSGGSQDVRAKPQGIASLILCPLFGTLHEESADASAPVGLIDDESGDFSRSFRKERVRHEDVNPPKQRRAVIGYKDCMFGPGEDLTESSRGFPGGGGVSELAGELSDALGVGS